MPAPFRLPLQASHGSSAILAANCSEKGCLTVLQSVFSFDRVAWRLANIAMCCVAAMAGISGCTKSDAPSSGSPNELPQPLNTFAFRPDSPAIRKVTVLDDDPELMHIRIQAEDGSSSYVHRSFVKLSEGGAILLTASEVLKKPAGDDQYFTLLELNQVRDKIPALFMTASGRRVVAPWKAPRFESRGEMAWPIYECLRADCPGREANAGHGHLFILPDPAYKIGSNVAVVEHAKEQAEALDASPSLESIMKSAQYLCPQCRAAGRPLPEEALKQSFRRFHLPESEKMWQALDDEYKRSRAARVRKFNPAGS